MIKLDRENWKIETDCRTVGEFMTEASQFGLSVKVTIDDCDEYFFKGGQKTKVVDNTPIDKVLFDRTDYLFNARTSFRVFTKPKPNTVKKSGFVNLYRGGILQGINCGYRVFASEQESREIFDMTADCEKFAVAKIEWEEVVK